jgi:tellurite resistance protein
MAAGPASSDDEDALPLSEDELQAMVLRATVALANPPGSVAPEPRPRRDVVEEAYDAVLRLVREVRRLRRREDRAKDALRTSLAVGDADSMKSAIEDVLDDSV